MFILSLSHVQITLSQLEVKKKIAECWLHLIYTIIQKDEKCDIFLLPSSSPAPPFMSSVVRHAWPLVSVI